MTRLIRLAACLLCAVCALASPAAAPQEPSFHDASDLVRVFATVADRDGHLVTTLTRGDFEVRDEGKPQPITLFDNSPRPLRLIVLLDVSGSMQGNLTLLREAAKELFTKLGPDDRARVGTFGREITISRSFTRDARELEAALPDYIAPDALTPLWRAIAQAMDALDDAGEERRVILVLSDGKDSGPTSFRERVVSQVDIIDRSRDENVMIYAVGMSSRSNRALQPGIVPGGLQAMMVADLPDPGLGRVAEESGGGYVEIRPSQDLGTAFARVADELHSQYLLGFDPPDRDGKVHDVTVRVSDRGLKTRARKTYRAPKDTR